MPTDEAPEAGDLTLELKQVGTAARGQSQLAWVDVAKVLRQTRQSIAWDRKSEGFRRLTPKLSGPAPPSTDRLQGKRRQRCGVRRSARFGGEFENESKLSFAPKPPKYRQY